MNLKQSMMENKKQIDSFLSDFLLSKILEAKKHDNQLADQIKLIKNQVLRGGKRVRPFIMGLTYALVGGEDTKTQVGLGAAIELTHQYLMIHDDIVDADEKRYGDLSLHKTFESQAEDAHFGSSMAMISGDYIHSLAHEIVLNLDIEEVVKVEILKQIQNTIQDTAMGLQIHYLQNKVPVSQASEDKYLKGMELVSARYTFESPALLGLLLGNNQELVPTLKRYAYLVGMAFQMQDDVLGVYGNTEVTGKPSGNDLREGKKTLLILRAYKNASFEQKEYIENHLGTKIDQRQIDELRDIITQTESLRKSEDTARSYVLEAKNLIKDIEPNNTNSIEMLLELADFVISREK